MPDALAELLGDALLAARDADEWVPLFPEAASTSAERVDEVFFAVLAITGFFAALIGLLMLAFVVRYRRSSSADRSNPVRRPLPYELVWIVIPTAIAVGVFVWSASVYQDLYTPPPDAVAIDVVGRQWMWKVQHPNGRREINSLHVPTGQPVKLVLTSQDVIHSFYVPAFRLKRDVLPDRYTTLWFEATRPGTYHLFCAEYCGDEHSGMQGTVTVMRPDAFQRWLSAGLDPPAPEPGTPGAPDAPLALGGGGTFFRLGCNACHLPSAAVRAPRLDGIYGRPVRLANDETVVADAAYVRESILRPNAKIVAGYEAPSLMPTYAGQVSEAELEDLVRFVAALRDGWPGRRVGEEGAR